MGFLDGLLKLAAPVAGFALGGPLGGMIGGAASSALGGAQAGAKADKASALQLALQKQRHDAGQPYRDKLPGLVAGLPTQRENLDSIFSDPGNPYARTISRPPAPSPMGAPVPPMNQGGSPFMSQPQIPPGLQNAIPRGLLQKILAKQQGNTATPQAPRPGMQQGPQLPSLLARIRASQGGFR
jgi:hypothetical protein